jgi:hypothetical protein
MARPNPGLDNANEAATGHIPEEIPDQGAPPTPPEVNLPVDPEAHMSELGQANNQIPEWLLPS